MNFDHDRPDNVSDYEAVYEFETPHGRQVHVHISAVGGGTVGREYAQGHWHYHVCDEETGDFIEEGSDLYTGRPHTHRQAAAELLDLVDYLTDDGA